VFNPCDRDKFLGSTDIEDVLRWLDKLSQEESRMVVTQGLKATDGVDGSVTGIGNAVQHVGYQVRFDNRMKRVDDKVSRVLMCASCIHTATNLILQS
jgi:hypothetical protein